MFIATDTQHLWARFVVFFNEGLSIGFALGLGRLLRLFLFLLFRCGGGGIFNQGHCSVLGS